jgi:hypothetical protein
MISTLKKVKLPFHQTGKRISPTRDKGRPGKLPGKRMSTNGNIYYEYRKNRSDMPGSRV